jgi:HK97 family phage major capsid protein
MPYNSIVTRTESDALIPEQASREIIKNVPQQSAVMSVARKLPNMSSHQFRMPVLSALATAYFISGATQSARDYGLKQTTEQAWANKYIYAEEIAAIVPIPENVISDIEAGGFDVWGEIRPSLEEAIGLAFDQAVLYGTNAPATWPTNILDGATAAGNSVVLGAVGDLYDDIMAENGLLSLVEQDGYMVNGHIGALTMKGKLRGLRGDDGQPLFVRDMQGAAQYSLDGSPIVFPVNGSVDAAQSLMFSGDFRQIVYSIRQDITWKILDQAIIQDSEGAIVYNLAQQDMLAMRVTFRCGWQLPNPINRVQSVEANRYPIAVLKPAP